MRDVLERYLRVLQAQALRDYELLLLTWAPAHAMGSKQKAPERPEILKW